MVVCYKFGKVYVLSFRGRIVYVGSSARVLRQRFAEHWYNRKRKDSIGSLYPFMVGTQKRDWSIKLLYDFPCSTKKELIAEECRAMRGFEGLLNIRGMPALKEQQEVPIQAFVKSSLNPNLESALPAIVVE